MPRREQEAKVPTKSHIAKLPHWARVAFAARCAQRVHPLFHLMWPNADESYATMLSGAIDTAVSLARIGGDGKSLDIKAACRAADSVAYNAAFGADDELGGERAAHVASAATRAVFAADVDEVYSTDYAADAGSFAADAADAATEANDIRFDANLREKLVELIANDFHDLLAWSTVAGWTDESPVDPDWLGPLWPEGRPKGWPEPEARPESELPCLKISVTIPANLDKTQSKEINQRIANVLVAAAHRHVELGGFGLRILDGESNLGTPLEDEAPAPTHQLEKKEAHTRDERHEVVC